ncbi:MAG: hypothetical protein NT163_00230 [Chlorobiales bacterium]|nr:hypothetical protein [Chlorobiales bacterium]
MVSFAETASKAPTATEASSKPTDKADATKNKTDKKADKKKADAKAAKEAAKEASKPATPGKSAVTAEKKEPAKNVTKGDYHGNTVDHIFHKPSCRYYNSKNNTAIFKTREEAIKAGYRPCKICKP